MSGIRLVEFMQQATDGGHPVGNGRGFEHGEYLVVLSKRDLAALARSALCGLTKKSRKDMKQLAALGDSFVMPVEPY